MRFVVDYNVVRADGSIRHPGQRDIDTDHIWLGDPAADWGNCELAARLVARQLVLADGDQIIVTDIRPA